MADMTGMDLARAIDMVRASSRLVSFSGAGLSAESGVPTFRDARTGGLWTKHNPMKLASPAGFIADPELVMAWYADRRRFVARALPNAAHRALAARTDMTHVTQNVDDLLHRAGAAVDRVLQLHGTIARDRCHEACGFEEAVNLAQPPALRDCPNCGNRLRPSVVWFGESLPPEVWMRAERACAECDALLVIGTSAEVYPAAGLIGLARASGAGIIIVNTQASAVSRLADVELIGPAGEIVPRLLG
jgi:NAD-dependent deacetylase